MSTNKSENAKSRKDLNNGDLYVNTNRNVVKGSQKFRFVIEHIDFCLFCKKKKENNEDTSEVCKHNNCDKEDIGDDVAQEKEENIKIDFKRLCSIGKTYDFLKRKGFNQKDLKKLENAQYFEKVIWAYYNTYDNLYLLSNNEVFFCTDESRIRTHMLYVKHLLSLIVFICYKYEEKGKHEIWDQIIYNRIDEFEKLVEIEKKNYTPEENYKIDERFNMYKEFLIHKFHSLFFNTLKLINYNFVFNEFMGNTHRKGKNREAPYQKKNYRKNLYKLNFLEKSFIIQFFINIYSSIDKKFLFKLCLDLCNPFIWNCINYNYLNEFLFKKNKEAKMLYNNLLKVMDKKYLNGRSYNVFDVYTCSCGLSNLEGDSKKTQGNLHDNVNVEEYDKSIILFINKNEFFYNLINYFLIVLDTFEKEPEEMDEITSNYSISSLSDRDSSDEEQDEYEKFLDIFNDEEDSPSIEQNPTLDNENPQDSSLSLDMANMKVDSHSIDNINSDDADNDFRDEEDELTDNAMDEEEVEEDIKGNLHKRARRDVNDESGIVKVEHDSSGDTCIQDEMMKFLESVEEYGRYISSDDEEKENFVNPSEYKKEEILLMFSKYENKLKGENKKFNYTCRVRKGKMKYVEERKKKYRILFVEKCIEFFIDLLSQLYSRRILYIFIKYFNVLIYCKISSLNRKRKFKELIKLLKYYVEMYIDNFSGNPLTYLEINNEHYRNFEYFQTFCYKHFKDHSVLKNYYLKSVFLMNKKKELLENLSKLEEKELLFLCEKLNYLMLSDTLEKSFEEGEAKKTPDGKTQKSCTGETDQKVEKFGEEDRMKSRDIKCNMCIKEGIFENVHLFRKKKKLFYITLLIENLRFKSNIFEEIDKQCDYPNERDLFENVLIDTKDDMKRKRKTFLYTKPLFKLNLQYLCINDYVFRIYNLFKLQSYYDIRKNVIEYVYETNPKNKKVNEHTVCKYVFEIDENTDFRNDMNGRSEGSGNKKIRKRKYKANFSEENQIVMQDESLAESSNRNAYNEYQLNSIVHDINKIENTYFANERRMSNKIDSFRIVSVDNNNKKVMGEIIIDLKYKYYERVNNEWNMIRPGDILFLVCVKNYTNHYKNKLNVINDNDLKKLLGINYLRGCEVFKYSNFDENSEELDGGKCSLKRITVYLDYQQYQKDIINDPEIYSSFNLLVRRKQKENNFFYILNNIKTLIMNPDDAVIPHWIHDIFLGYCDSSLKYYQKSLPRKVNSGEGGNNPHLSEVRSCERSDSDEGDSEEDYSEEEDSDEGHSEEEESDEGNSEENHSDYTDKEEVNGNGEISNKKKFHNVEGIKECKKKMVCNREKLNFIRKNIDDINYLNTFLNILHVIKTTNVAYLCVDSSYMNVLNGKNKVDIKSLLNEYVEPLFLSYAPIRYEHKKTSLEKNMLQKNILEILYYHICVINNYKADDMEFVEDFVKNITAAHRYGNFYIFQFEFKAKEYYLILNSYLGKVKSEGEIVRPVTNEGVQESPEKGEEREAEKNEEVGEVEKNEEAGEAVLIDDHNIIQKIFEENLKNAIKYLSLKGDIYRIQNRIYDDQSYPLEGLLIHTKKRNSTNASFVQRESGKDEEDVTMAGEGISGITVMKKKQMYYTERQIECLKSGLYEGITIIEGVPGSGKTSILNKIINILFNNKRKEKILICTHSNSCLNYIFNLLVKENLIHQKYLCRVGMGELDIENLRNEYEELEKSLIKNGNMEGNENSVMKKSGIDFYDEDDNFNFSKYGRINYMIDLRQKMLNEVNLLSESNSNHKIYHCLSATQYYENHIKKRISNFFKYIKIFKNNKNDQNFFKLCITEAIDDYDIYNLFLCPKIYVKEFENVQDLVWAGKEEKRTHYNNTCREIEKLQILDEDKSCFYLIHPEDQLNTLHLSIFNILFPFKKYLNLKLNKISIDQYLEYKNFFIKRNNVEYLGSENEELNMDFVEAQEGSMLMKDMELEKVNERVTGQEEKMSEKGSTIMDKNIIQERGKDGEILTKPRDEYDMCRIFGGNITGLIFKNNEEDLHICKYYLANLIKNFEHLNDCRAFEVLKNQRERGVYIIAKLARVIAMTCTHASINRSKIAKLQFYFDNIIIDECTQITENDTFLPLLLQENRYYKSKLKRIIFVGDSNQLPPIIKNKYIKNFANYEQSLYKRFLRLELPSIYLNEQGRMRNEICNIYKYFYSKYNIQIANLDCVYKDKFSKNFNPGFTYTYQFIHVESDEYTPVPYFYQNLLEAEMVVAIFMYMRLLGYANEIITILTTYNGQKELILDILKKNCLYNKLIGMPKKVTTVDKYQGKQNDYVIISLVRSKSIGYMKNIKRLIVAFSRARFGLYVVGNYNLYKKNQEFKKPLYFFRKNKLELSLQMNEQFSTTQREHKIPPIIVKDLNHFYTIIYSLANAHFQRNSA
ncbi:hypothetical protein, conserved [Plasmodium gonderi]|uniref:P-loop containing nucleoside triphosphate hydrolase n=1 Tax=Plasmodium gonderi TaxID=77519 RepID=A0A1Y1JHN9_PLAGO|nr:hypothetical protein, conserved [Plasmodium gonderi]GAW82049.1 hypothetical protein, conserved [Plasmodium gonderi]